MICFSFGLGAGRYQHSGVAAASFGIPALEVAFGISRFSLPLECSLLS